MVYNHSNSNLNEGRPHRPFLMWRQMEMGQVSNYFSWPVVRVGTNWREELDQNWQLSPLRDNQRLPLGRCPGKSMQTQVLPPCFSMLHPPPPPAAGTAPEELSWQAPWCHIMKCQLTWCKQAPAADGQHSPACFWAEASVNWPDNAIKTSFPHAA